MNIFVGNLSREATEDQLQKAFEAFGKTSSVKIARDLFSRESKGFAFIEMPVRTEAETAIKTLNATQFMGKPLNVNEARPRPDHRGGGRR